MPVDASTKPASPMPRRLRPLALAPSEAGSGPGHEQEEQDVVDRHHRPDGGAPLADRGLHEQRDERAEEWTRDTRKESTQPDHGAGAIRHARRSNRFRWYVGGNQGRR